MEGMASFDYDQYFPDETFIIDDFGEICEDIVRIAGTGSQLFYKDFESELAHPDSTTPPGSYTAARCFEKELPSLFSEMEYLTEVLPEPDTTYRKSVPLVVNPVEFSCKRPAQSQHAASSSTLVEPSTTQISNACVDDSACQGHIAEERSPNTERGQLSEMTAPMEYQRILNNYIQKGRRKLEASSYSKMKATCLTKEKSICRSTSTIGTPTTPHPGHLLSGLTVAHHSATSAAAMVNPLSVLPDSASRPPVPCSSTTAYGADRSSSATTTAVCQKPQGLPKGRTGVANRTAANLPKATKTYRCQDCSSTFPSSEHLRRHTCIIALHYQCQLCLREFKKRKTLEHHMKSHDKVFSTDDDLRK
ncbi:uncharacterized protein LOC126581610 [Anopheles aquasalis]|uniref:uncharacterized protein LOC126581610 n=1 Tax=Anopheles aquasalis TaxID=42839 RepID=UPI00215B1AC0|nr:uncharacterized protein LOC126581610 [Anopheles aquasalis]